MGARGGGVTPTPSSSAALVLPLPLLPLPPLVSLLDRLLVASLISTSTAVSPCVCPCEPASELLRHAAQPQPLRSACAPEPTPHLIIQDMSTAFHRRHGRQEPGQGRGQPPSPGQGSLVSAGDLVELPHKLLLYPSHSWGPLMAPLPGHPRKRAARSPQLILPLLWTTPQEGSANSVSQLLASLTPDSSIQPPPDPTPPPPSRWLLETPWESHLFEWGGGGQRRKRAG